MNEITTLKKLLEDFNSATESLRQSYADLEVKFSQINAELENKNRELEISVAEKEEMGIYLQNILESLTNGVIVVDTRGIVQSQNRAAGIFTEMNEKDAVGKHISHVLDLSPFDEKDYLSSEVKIRLKGRSLRVFAAPLTTKNNDSLGMVLVLHDVTKVERLEEMAKRNEKFALMTELAASVAEEIRNPLGSIELFTGLLMKDVADKKERQRLEQVEAAVRKIDHKIANLLMFTQVRDPDMKKVNVNEVLKEALSFAEFIVAQGSISIDCRFTDSDPSVVGDVEMLKQVFLNIILNSIQAMPEGGRLAIESGMIVEENVSQNPVSYLQIEFRDNGTGIPEENMSRIFDPFFSTKEGRSGLGLTIVHNIIYLHRGTVHVENAEDGGTVVTLLLPCSGDPR